MRSGAKDTVDQDQKELIEATIESLPKDQQNMEELYESRANTVKYDKYKDTTGENS